MLAPRSKGLHVLIVDDDDSLRRALARTIRLAGFEVDAFRSVEALMAHGVPDRDACLVLDVDVPGIGGIEFTRTLAAAGRDLAPRPAAEERARPVLVPHSSLRAPLNDGGRTRFFGSGR